MALQMKYAGRSLNKGDMYTEHTCSVCEGTEHKVLVVNRSVALIQCCTCRNSASIERPILFKTTPCHETTTV